MSKEQTKSIEKPKPAGPLAVIKGFLADESVKARLNEMLGKGASSFANSIVNVVGGSRQLQAIAQRNPSNIMAQCMKAASVKLPIDPALQQAAIVPYGDEAQFQVMYKGWIQLCIRSGLYKHINCTEVYEDEIDFYNPITGEVVFKDPKTYKMRYEEDRDKYVVGHYIYFKLLSGFEHSGYITCGEAMAHAKKYSKAYQYDLAKGRNTSAWSTNPIPMGNKTALLKHLPKYGAMSIEMQNALTVERESFEDAQLAAEAKITDESGSEPIDTTFEPADPADATFQDDPEGKAAAQAKADAEKAKLAAGEAKKQWVCKQPKSQCSTSGVLFDEPVPGGNNKPLCPTCRSANIKEAEAA